MKKFPIILFLVGVLFIGGCIEEESDTAIIRKNTSEMVLGENDLPAGWKSEDYFSHNGFTIVKFKNTFSNDTLYIYVDRFKSSDIVEKWFETSKSESEQFIMIGDSKRINIEDIFSKNTKCFSYVHIPKYYGDPKNYVIGCGIKNIRFSIELASKGSINEENKELLMILAKTLENKIIT